MMYCFAKLCRLCTKNINITSTLHTTDADEIQLKDKLISIMPELVPVDEKLPTHVCVTCHERLRDAYDFKIQCLQSRDVLMGYLAQMKNLNLDGNQVQQVAEISMHKYESNLISNIKVENENLMDISVNIKQELPATSNELVPHVDFKPNLDNVDESFALTAERKLSFVGESSTAAENEEFIKNEIDTVGKALEESVSNEFYEEEERNSVVETAEPIPEQAAGESSTATENEEFIKNEIDLYDNATETFDNDIFKAFVAREKAQQLDTAVKALEETVPSKFYEEDARNLAVEKTEPIPEQVENDTGFTEPAKETNELPNNTHADETVVDSDDTRQLRRREASKTMVQYADDDDLFDEHEAMDDFDYSSSGSEFQMCSDDASDDCEDSDDDFNMTIANKPIAPRAKEINRFIASPANCLHNTPSVVHSSNKMNNLNVVNEITKASDGVLFNSNTVRQAEHIPMEAGSGNDVASSVTTTEVRLNNEVNPSKHVEEENNGTPEILRNSNTEVQSEHLHKVAGTNLSATYDPEEPTKFTLQHPIDRFIKNPILKQFFCKTCNLQVCDSITLIKHLKRHAEVTQVHSNNKIIQFDSVNKVNEASEGVLLNSNILRKPEKIEEQNKMTQSNHVEKENDVSSEIFSNSSTEFRSKYLYKIAGTNLSAIRDSEEPTKFTLQHPIDPDTKYVFIRNTEMQIFVCKTCNLQVRDSCTLTNHMRRHVTGNKIACKICNKRMYNNKALREHMYVHRTDRPFACTICEKKFKSKGMLGSHMSTHNKTICCEYCAALFANNALLKEHIVNKHSQEKKFICSLCGAAFKRLNTLKKHTLTHDKSIKYECDICNKVVGTKNGLKNHKIYLHTDPATWKHTCNMCNKKYKEKCQLATHMRLHTGEKPHVCEHCGKAFRTKQAYMNHVRTHTGHRPFVCQVCDRGFTQATSRDVHMRTHTGEKPYKCQECGKCYTQSYVYYQHVKKKHPKTEGSKEASDEEQDSDQSSSS